MKAIDLSKQFNMKPHEENGLFALHERRTENDNRGASGSIYYYLGPLERSIFHSLDCDEYWCYHSGTTLEIWIIDEEHRLQIKKCGIEKGAQPLVFLPKGSIFAARHGFNHSDGTFISCITVPEYADENCRLYTKEEVIEICSQTFDFWRAPRFQ